MNDMTDWRHDREHIHMLQNAHADRIEAEFNDDARIDAEQVDIKRLGGMRTFYSSKEGGFHQRAILSGNETPEQIDTVLQHFVEKESHCWIEVNPANFYSSDPASGPSIILHLLQRGCVIKSFRAVWMRDRPLGPDEQDFRLDCRPVENNIVYEQYIIASVGSSADDLPEIESGPGFFYFMGFHEGRAVSWTTMYCDGESGYLMNADTLDDFTRRGYHSQLIRLRVQHAFEMGAKRVYTHTEFNSQSARNLQRNGFQLAYNYIMLRRDPMPLS